MQAVKKQLQKYYTPKKLLINALIMLVAVIFFLNQKPGELLYPLLFGGIGAVYLLAFFYLKLRSRP